MKLNMLEINDLGQILQEKMGISDQQLYGMGGGSMGMGGGGGGVNVGHHGRRFWWCRRRAGGCPDGVFAQAGRL